MKSTQLRTISVIVVLLALLLAVLWSIAALNRARWDLAFTRRALGMLEMSGGPEA